MGSTAARSPELNCNVFTSDEFRACRRSTSESTDQPAAATERAALMRIVLSDFMSLDGVVQSPGGQGEDTDGGFAHGGWSMPFFEPETMGPAVTETMDGTGALLFG